MGRFNKEMTKELLEKYFGDGFAYVCIELEHGEFRVSSLRDDLSFFKHKVVIISPEYNTHIPYKNIMDIVI